MRLIQTVNNNGNHSINRNNHNNIDQRINSLLNTLKRFTILVYVSILMTVILLAILMIASAMITQESRYSNSIGGIAMLIDLNVSILSITLQFPFYDKIYYKCCQCCIKLKFFQTVKDSLNIQNEIQLQ